MGAARLVEERERVIEKVMSFTRALVSSLEMMDDVTYIYMVILLRW